ncbi:MAG: c-type cytochrome [Planctomycetota bacterium]
MKNLHPIRRFHLLLIATLAMLSANLSPASLLANSANWIWTPQKSVAPGGSKSPLGECFFRKKFTLIKPEKAEIEFVAGDQYEIFINGRLATRGNSFGKKNKLDVMPWVVPGVNLIAVRVTHLESLTPGLAMTFRVKEESENRWRGLSTDRSWKTRTTSTDQWKSTSYNDLGWLAAQPIETSSTDIVEDRAAEKTSPLRTDLTNSKDIKKSKNVADANSQQARALPTSSSARMPSKLPVSQNSQPKVNPTSESSNKTNDLDSKFKINSEFSIQKILTPEETGSLIAMEFNEFGKIIFAKENGGLMIADPSLPPGDDKRIRLLCSDVKNCQGILPLNGKIYVTGSGPQGQGLYCLTDADRDGIFQVDKKLISFSGKPGEHGPHGIQLGPDGMLYVVVGNGSQLVEPFAKTSPYIHHYEGDMVPRYEDPGGHAVGVKAPGGTVLRCSLDGQKIERFAGGIRNAYDLVFDQFGELFIHDSDMEADAGTTWYRPTYVFHVPAGAEMGWRSGWAKFSQYLVDQNPAAADTGRGSPTGCVLYQHLQFPLRYQNSIFLADWSEGRILNIKPEVSGAGYTAKTETFLTGRPLNVVDLAVGEDGGLYFCTGGRGTEGGVYRIVWNGDVPENVIKFSSDLEKIIRHPQPNSAWARLNIAKLKQTLGNEWNPAIEGVALEQRNEEQIRIRALQLMVLYGPSPNSSVLEKLAEEESFRIRCQVALLCGLKGDAPTAKLLRRLLNDSHPMVRRVSGEAIVRRGIQVQFDDLTKLLASSDRAEALIARRLLERIPAGQWEERVIQTDDIRIFIEGSVALMTAHPNLKRSYQILAKGSQWMDGFINDFDFVDLLRTMQLALVQGKVDAEKIPGLTIRIGNEFPSGNSTINRELARLMAFLKVGNLNGRIPEYMQSTEVTDMDKVHVGMYLQASAKTLTPGARLAILDALEQAFKKEGVGGSYKIYISRAIEDLSRSFTDQEVAQVLKNGDRWPNAVVSAFYRLPKSIDAATIDAIITMDQQIRRLEVTDSVNARNRLGVIAILGRNGDQESMNYLRNLWLEEPDRRNDIVIGLAEQPGEDNWSYLVSSLPILDDLTAQEILKKLAEVKRRPRESRHYRDAIMLGYRLRESGAMEAMKLLKHWTSEDPAARLSGWKPKMDAWKTWFEKQWPKTDPIKVATSQGPGRQGKSVEQLLANFEKGGLGSSARGKHLFLTAQCASCHQMGNLGEGSGPDLTNLANRFSIREVLESTVNPSQVISDRYASKKILTVDGNQFNGMAVEQADGSYFVLQQDGSRIRIAADDIDEIQESKISAMPSGLLDNLTESEIKDLFAFLMDSSKNMAAMPALNKKSVAARNSRTNY